jgi:hypothetical protein
MDRKAMAIAEMIIAHFMLQTSDRQEKANLVCGARPSVKSKTPSAAAGSPPALVGTTVQAIESPDFLLAHFYGKFGLN